MAKRYGFQDDLSDLLSDLDGLTADLEDIRDDAQDETDESGDPAAREAVRELDDALTLLAQAAEKMEKWS